MSQHTKHGCDHIFFIGFLGAGKSTLGNVLMGNPRYQITGGQILFKG